MNLWPKTHGQCYLGGLTHAHGECRFETTIYLNAGKSNVVGYVRRSFAQSHFTIQLDAGIEYFIESGLEGLRSANDSQGTAIKPFGLLGLQATSTCTSRHKALLAGP